jgi:hypothetical protein
MVSSTLSKSSFDVLVVPDDVMHMIFSDLDTRVKVNAGLVCKQWDQLLKVRPAAGRHWIIDFNINSVVARTALAETHKESFAHQPAIAAGRCDTVHVFPQNCHLSDV